MTTSAEARAHAEIAEILQRIWTRDGIKVEGVRTQWISSGGISRHDFILNGIELSSQSYFAKKS